MATAFEKALASAQPHTSMMAYGASGTPGRVITARDQKVCLHCQSEAKNPNSQPPYHPNCRCHPVQLS